MNKLVLYAYEGSEKLKQLSVIENADNISSEELYFECRKIFEDFVKKDKAVARRNKNYTCKYIYLDVDNIMTTGDGKDDKFLVFNDTYTKNEYIPLKLEHLTTMFNYEIN